ncbi:hypothetical protein FQN53_005904 [Emmonsiellopsis sp. PD_33]|nr:hypothetical protein FQN53_005904 [Emmonsiellopsis sp. PD_33]
MSSSHRPLESQSFPSTGFDLVDPSVLLEEETIPNYKPQRFYPVRIGQVLNQQYQVVGKLGYGASSTVWLCRDLLGHDYVTLKIYVNSSRMHRELPIYRHLDKIHSNHPGRRCLRMLLDSFIIDGPDGQHVCRAHHPLGMSLHELKTRTRGKVFSKDVLRTATILQLLAVVDYLLKEAHVIHTGEARLGDEEHQDDIMPDVYRAPEVILGMKWGYKVDIWNVAMVIWDLFEHDRLFQARNSNGGHDDAYHLAQMVAVLGPPPLDFLKQGTNFLKYWDESGNWRGLAPIPDINLEKLEQRLTGDDKDLFLHFVKRMLCWMPEQRPTAEEAIFDPWLMEGLFDTSN